MVCICNKCGRKFDGFTFLKRALVSVKQLWGRLGSYDRTLITATGSAGQHAAGSRPFGAHYAKDGCSYLLEKKLATAGTVILTDQKAILLSLLHQIESSDFNLRILKHNSKSPVANNQAWICIPSASLPKQGF